MQVTTRRQATTVESESPEQYLESIRSKTTEQLREELGHILGITADNLMRMAAIVKVLEDRGEDLSSLRIGLIHHLRRIAGGQLLPEVIVRFADHPMLVQKVAALPLQDQRRIVDGFPIEVVTGVTEEGQFVVEQVDPTAANRDQLLLAFAANRLRSKEEQANLLKLRVAREARRREPAPVRGNVRADRSTGTIVVGRTHVTPADILAALADLNDVDQEPEDVETTTVLVRASQEELRRLKVRAAEARTSMAALVRRALGNAGLLR